MLLVCKQVEIEKQKQLHMYTAKVREKALMEEKERLEIKIEADHEKMRHYLHVLDLVRNAED